MQHLPPRNLTSAACMLLLAGCTVSPEPITHAEISMQTAGLLERVTLAQEPVSGSIDLYEAMARALKYNLACSIRPNYSDRHRFAPGTGRWPG